MRKPLIAGAALLALAASALPASASLVGAAIQVDWLFPDLDTPVESTGLQDPIEIGSPYDFTTSGLSVSFSANQITITNLNSSGYFSIAPFNGLDFLVYYPHLISVTEDPASDPLFAKGSVLTFDGVVDLNLSGTCMGCAGGEKIILDAATSVPMPVPEPTSAALVGTGLLGLCLAMRRRSVRGAALTGFP